VELLLLDFTPEGNRGCWNLSYVGTKTHERQDAIGILRVNARQRATCAAQSSRAGIQAMTPLAGFLFFFFDGYDDVKVRERTARH